MLKQKNNNNNNGKDIQINIEQIQQRTIPVKKEKWVKMKIKMMKKMTLKETTKSFSIRFFV